MGDSKGRIKGTSIRSALSCLRDRDCLDAAIAMVPAEHRHVFESDILPALWYPLQPYLSLLAAVRRVEKENADRVFGEIGRRSITDTLRGMYKVFNRPGGTEWLIRHAPILWNLFFTELSLEILEFGPGRGLARMKGDVAVVPEFCETICGGMDAALTASGAKDVRTHHIACKSTGSPDCLFESTWRA